MIAFLEEIEFSCFQFLEQLMFWEMKFFKEI